MCPCVSMSVSKALWSCVSHPNTTHRIPDIPAGRNYSTRGRLSSPLLECGGQTIGTRQRNGTQALARPAGPEPSDCTWKRSWCDTRHFTGAAFLMWRSATQVIHKSRQCVT